MIARTVPLDDGTQLPVCIVPPAPAAHARGATVVLAHGAGSDMRHPALVRIQSGLARVGLTAVTFDFPYRARGARVPDRLPVLVAAYRAVVAAIRRDPDLAPRRLVIGGRSLGGRVASHVVAAGARVDGLVLLGFPLHPPGRPGVSRAAHLSSLAVPMLFLQGTRDTFAQWDLLTTVLAGLPAATLHAIPDADHGFHVPKRSGRTDVEVLGEVVETIEQWIARI